VKVKVVPNSWMLRDGRRLDCGPYMSGALEARVLLDKLSVSKEPLFSVCSGGQAGIYHAGRETRRWVTDPAVGVPFLGSTDILAADLTGLPLLSRAQVRANPRLLVHSGWTLITRTGTIGRIAYCRPNMDGLACSEHVMRVVPDAGKIPPGYLYAYLASKFGLPLVTGGTYGSIIQSIEPQHIVGLPVPRFGSQLETEVHELVENAASLRGESSRLLEDAKRQTARLWGIDSDRKFRATRHPDVRVVPASTLQRTSRFDAFFYGSAATESDETLSDISRRMPVKKIGDSEVTKQVFETTRFGRVMVEDERFGVPFLSISDMMRGDPKAESFISRKQAVTVRAIVDAGWLLLPRVGQLQGAFGTVSFVARHLAGVAVSDNNLRVVPVGEDEGAYLWAALSTDLIYQQIIRRACGTSIPYLDARRVADIPVPWPGRDKRLAIAEDVKTAMEMRSKAAQFEGKAIAAVEHAIARGAT
jgi:type I restriction enzyme S subunit